MLGFVRSAGRHWTRFASYALLCGYDARTVRVLITSREYSNSRALQNH